MHCSGGVRLEGLGKVSVLGGLCSVLGGEGVGRVLY